MNSRTLHPARTAVLLIVLASVLAGCMPALADAQAPAAESPQPVAQSSIGLGPAQTSEPAPPEPTNPEPTARPERSPRPTPGSATRRPFSMNLYEDGDFVPQHTFDWCVAASVQMTWNLVRDDRRSSFRDQQQLWEMARERSQNAFGGANPFGWASVLTEIGLGRYEVVSIGSYDRALRRAASALRQTNRPVGLVMWRGRHAWVMSGFESRGDPARTDDFVVTGIRVLDPLFPHGSSLWGPSPRPNALLTPRQLAADFLVREPRNWSLDVPSGWLLVLPT